MQKMKDILKQEKGVSLASLAIAVIIILAITGMLIYNSNDTVYIKNLTNMYNDISNLRNKISDYYAEYGTIPVSQIYTNTGHLAEVAGANDTGDYYVIDLNALDGLTLNYGQDYEKVKTSDSQSFIDSNKDLYIINYNSHNIFYVAGIGYEINGQIKTYYTDEIEPDIEKVKLNYVDGIRVPDDAEYIEGNKTEGLMIQKDGVQYVWNVLEKELNYQNTEDAEFINSLNLEDSQKENFVKSANTYEGFYKETVENNPRVIYFNVDEQNNWLYYYKNEGIYKDDNGEEAYIPAGCSVSTTPSINRINKGLVIKDESDNEYVWIPVPKNITIDTSTDSEIETALKEYTKEFRQEGYEDTWYEGCGLTQNDYNTKKSTMLNSIKENGGFYIARYEMGVEKNAPKVSESTGTIEALIETNGLPISKKDQYPYNFVTCSQAEQLAERIAPTGRTSSLMFGIQWDLVLKYLNVKGGLSIADLTEDSTSWGNYANSELPITSNNAKKSEDKGANYTSITGTKTKDSSILLTTGASNDAELMNIYDLAGNVWEWTLEKTAHSDDPCTDRGGSYNYFGSDDPAAYHSSTNTTYNSEVVGFRVSLY